MKHLTSIALASLLLTGTAWAQAGAPAAAVTPPATNPSAAQLSDDQIQSAVKVANQGEIDEANIALKSGKDKAVKDFAKMMIKDHGKVKKELVTLTKSEKLKTADSDLKKSFEDAGKTSKDKIKGLKGADFDKAYMEDQVSMHQDLLSALDSTLIPSAKNTKLKALLEKIRPDVAAHLEKAKAWQGSGSQM